MLGKEMLTTEFAYNAARNQRMLAHAAECTEEQLDAETGYSMGSLRATLVHLLMVELGWRSALAGVTVDRSNPPLAPTATVAAMQAFQREDAETARTYVESLSDDDLAGTVTLARGSDSYDFVRWTVLQHILFHSAQHRSEAAELLTRYGHSPGDTDFIYYITRGPDAR